jgi:hypothetical protein
MSKKFFSVVFAATSRYDGRLQGLYNFQDFADNGQASVIWSKVNMEPYHGIQEKIYDAHAISRFGSLLMCDNRACGVCMNRN